MDFKTYIDEIATLQAKQEAMGAMLRRPFWIDSDCVIKTEYGEVKAVGGRELRFDPVVYDAADCRISLDQVNKAPRRWDAYMDVCRAWRDWSEGRLADIPTPESLGMYSERPAPEEAPGIPAVVRLKNLCGHDVDVVMSDGSIRHIKADTLEKSVRAYFNDERQPDLDGIPVVRAVLDRVDGLPEPEPGVILIVSSFAMQYAGDRKDLVCPDTRPGSGAEKDGSGRIMTVRQLRRA